MLNKQLKGWHCAAMPEWFAVRLFRQLGKRSDFLSFENGHGTDRPKWFLFPPDSNLTKGPSVRLAPVRLKREPAREEKKNVILVPDICLFLARSREPAVPCLTSLTGHGRCTSSHDESAQASSGAFFFLLASSPSNNPALRGIGTAGGYLPWLRVPLRSNACCTARDSLYASL